MDVLHSHNNASLAGSQYVWQTSISPFSFQEKANSSEELLVRDSAVVLIETAKEKLKGAAQAGLVAPAAAPAVRAAVVRAAATLHEADKRIKRAQQAKVPPRTTSIAAGPAWGLPFSCTGYIIEISQIALAHFLRLGLKANVFLTEKRR